MNKPLRQPRQVRPSGPQPKQQPSQFRRLSAEKPKQGLRLEPIRSRPKLRPQSKQQQSSQASDRRIQVMQQKFNAQLQEMRGQISRLTRMLTDKDKGRPDFFSQQSVPDLPIKEIRHPSPLPAFEPPLSQPTHYQSPKQQKITQASIAQVQALLKVVKLQRGGIRGHVVDGYLKKNSKGVVAKFSSSPEDGRLKRQFLTYQVVWKHAVIIGQHAFPKVLDFVQDHQYNVLVLDRLGPPIQTMMSRPFDWPAIAALGLALLKSLHFLHGIGYILRNLSPHHVLANQVNHVAIVDLSMAVKLQGRGRSFEDPWYCDCSSTALLDGREQGKGDDIESLCYLLLKLGRGGFLPWSQASTRKQMRAQRSKYTLKQLCKGAPAGVCQFLQRGISGSVQYSVLQKTLETQSGQLRWDRQR